MEVTREEFEDLKRFITNEFTQVAEYLRSLHSSLPPVMGALVIKQTNNSPGEIIVDIPELMLKNQPVTPIRLTGKLDVPKVGSWVAVFSWTNNSFKYFGQVLDETGKNKSTEEVGFTGMSEWFKTSNPQNDRRLLESSNDFIFYENDDELCIETKKNLILKRENLTVSLLSDKILIKSQGEKIVLDGETEVTKTLVVAKDITWNNDTVPVTGETHKHLTPTGESGIAHG